MTGKEHWEAVYTTKSHDAVSWYQPSAARSLALIQRVVRDRSAPIIDVGGGASVLVDELLRAGYGDVTVVDLAPSALATARARLGEGAGGVRWIEGDIRTVPLPVAAYALWHDRAVFHFLVDAAGRAAYRAQLQRALRADGFALVATFAEDGPTRCSGLPVCRYSVEELRREMGQSFELVTHERDVHYTPAGGAQAFNYCLFQKVAARPGSTSATTPE